LGKQKSDNNNYPTIQNLTHPKSPTFPKLTPETTTT